MENYLLGDYNSILSLFILLLYFLALQNTPGSSLTLLAVGPGVKQFLVLDDRI